MEVMVMALIPIALLALLIAGVGMFVDVAFFDGDRPKRARERLARLWEPPYVRGRELLAWARDQGAAAAGVLLAREGRPDGRSDVVRDLHDGADLAMLPHVSFRDSEKVVPCPADGQGRIGVTTPEVLDLVAWIRGNLPDRDWEKIVGRARELADGEADIPSVCPAGCALLGDDCVCMAYEARPLRCRPLHAAAILQTALGRSHDEEPSDRVRARVVAEGVEEGWSRTLSAAGLDGTVYELNSALAVAMETPDLASRWSAGEAVLAGCAPGPARTLRL